MIQEPKGSLVRRLSAMFSPIRIMPEDFTEPGPVVTDEPDKRDEALKIARIALYDVSIAPGGLVADSYRNRATRAIVQINALKISDEHHD